MPINEPAKNSNRKELFGNDFFVNLRVANIYLENWDLDIFHNFRSTVRMIFLRKLFSWITIFKRFISFWRSEYMIIWKKFNFQEFSVTK